MLLPNPTLHLVRDVGFSSVARGEEALGCPEDMAAPICHRMDEASAFLRIPEFDSAISDQREPPPIRAQTSVHELVSKARECPLFAPPRTERLNLTPT